MRVRTSAILFLAATLFSVSFAFSDDKSANTGTFTGQISDSICAVEGSHKESMAMSKDMGKTAASCATACVDRMNAKFVLYDPAHKKTYRLSDQAQARKFAGRDVKVTGTLKKNEIAVTSIEPQ